MENVKEINKSLIRKGVTIWHIKGDKIKEYRNYHIHSINALNGKKNALSEFSITVKKHSARFNIDYDKKTFKEFAIADLYRLHTDGFVVKTKNNETVIIKRD